METTKRLVRAVDAAHDYSGATPVCRARSGRRLVAARGQGACRRGRRVAFTQAALLYRRRQERARLPEVPHPERGLSPLTVENDIDIMLSIFEEELRAAEGYIEFVPDE